MTGDGGPGPGRVRRDLRARAVLGRRCRRALKQLVESAQIRILDLVGVVTELDGRFTAVEPELLSGLAALDSVEGEVGGLLSEDDIALASGALHPGTSALLVVVEDRWAQLLADAARARRREHHRRRADPAAPARAVPAVPHAGRSGGGAVMKRVASSRRRHVDLLRRRPVLDAVPVDPPAPRPCDAVDQLRALLHLVERGVLSAEEFERQEEKVFRRPPGTLAPRPGAAAAGRSRPPPLASSRRACGRSPAGGTSACSARRTARTRSRGG